MINWPIGYLQSASLSIYALTANRCFKCRDHYLAVHHWYLPLYRLVLVEIITVVTGNVFSNSVEPSCSITWVSDPLMNATFWAPLPFGIPGDTRTTPNTCVCVFERSIFVCCEIREVLNLPLTFCSNAVRIEAHFTHLLQFEPILSLISAGDD